MPLFFIDKDNIAESHAKIVGDDARHIARSLRMAVGDTLSVSCGDGEILKCELSKIRDDECDLKILARSPSGTKSPVDITLFMAYPKSDKLEVIIQKSTELGVMKITPFESSRCIKRPSEDKAARRLARLNKIAREACSQCARGELAVVTDTLSFPEMLTEASKYDLALFCYEGGGTESIKSLLERAHGVHSVAVIVGCEGGFSPEEAVAAEGVGLSMCGLGSRILRCETAPLLAISAISYRFEL